MSGPPYVIYVRTVSGSVWRLGFRPIRKLALAEKVARHVRSFLYNPDAPPHQHAPKCMWDLLRGLRRQGANVQRCRVLIHFADEAPSAHTIYSFLVEAIGSL